MKSILDVLPLRSQLMVYPRLKRNHISFAEIQFHNFNNYLIELPSCKIENSTLK
jgi:hypothetical protein